MFFGWVRNDLEINFGRTWIRSDWISIKKFRQGIQTELSIRMNPCPDWSWQKFRIEIQFKPNNFETKNKNYVQINLSSESFAWIRIENLVWIHLDWFLSDLHSTRFDIFFVCVRNSEPIWKISVGIIRIKDLSGLNWMFNRFASNKIQNLFRIGPKWMQVLMKLRKDQIADLKL